MSFQSNAFQNDAFQIETPYTTGGGVKRNSRLYIMPAFPFRKRKKEEIKILHTNELEIKLKDIEKEIKTRQRNYEQDKEIESLKIKQKVISDILKSLERIFLLEERKKIIPIARKSKLELEIEEEEDYIVALIAAFHV